MTNISVGDTIRLDIASVSHGIESVTVTAVGTAGPGGTGLTVAAPLTFDHADNLPFSDRGTGITFEPATAFAHSSNEPVQPLGRGITLDRALARAHGIDAPVRDAQATTAGYQGPPAPNQWFGGPALSPSAGSLVLRDAAGLVVDSLNYGGLVDPWVAEGDQGTSGFGAGGCRVTTPSSGRGRGAGPGAPLAAGANRSAGRFPDGADTDSNCSDFLTQAATTLVAASVAGAIDIKVAGVADLEAGEAITIDAGASLETAVIATARNACGRIWRRGRTSGVSGSPRRPTPIRHRKTSKAARCLRAALNDLIDHDERIGDGPIKHPCRRDARGCGARSGERSRTSECPGRCSCESARETVSSVRPR